MSKLYSTTIFIVVILFLSAQSAFAQLKSTFVKAQILLQDGKVITGYVQDDEASVMNYNISFKAKETDRKVTVYDTSAVKSLILENGEMYELIHYKGKYMTDSIAALAKSIVKGKASLYETFYKGEEIFIVTKDGISYPLQNDKLETGATELTVYDYKIYLNKVVWDAHISSNRVEKTSFSEKSFTALISSYNKAVNAENNIVAVKRKPVHFIIATVGGMIKNSNEKEVYLQGIYRSYFPKVSRSTSMNIGVNYFNYHYSGLNKYGHPKNFITTLISLPLQIQQNFLNKSIRPFAFAGLNVSYLKVVDDKGVTQLDKGLQQNIGVGMLYGAGIETDIKKGIMLKSEYRYENFTHLIMVGIGYNFSK